VRLPLRPLGVSKIPLVDPLIDENRVVRNIAESDRENLAWPHSVEDGHPEDQAFAGVKHPQSLADLFWGHHPSIRIRLAPDLLVPTASGMNAYLGKGDGTFTLKSSTPLSATGYVAVADFNRDGNLDFATSGNLLALGNGDVTFQTPVPLVANPPMGLFSNLAVGDLNGDGWPDLVFTSGAEDSATIWALLNNQHGGFNVNTIPTCLSAFTIPCDPSEVIITDVNGDGKPDLVVGETSHGGVTVYLGDGKGGFTPKQALKDALNAPGPIMVADVNGDGIPDIGLMEAGTPGIFLGKGDGTFNAPFYIGAGPSPGDILAVNLHGQPATAGHPDLVAPDGSGGVMVLINTSK
jgi:hypothetical protein